MSTEITADHIGKMIRVRNNLGEWLEREYVGVNGYNRVLCKEKGGWV